MRPPIASPVKPPRSAYAGLFLLSAGALLFQVTLIRVFSAAIWYHFAFLVVSIALFGIGASGVALALGRRTIAAAPAETRSGRRAEPAPAESAPRDLSFAPLGFAASTIVAYSLVQVIPFAPFDLFRDPAQIGWFLLDDLLLAVPFFFFGSTVAQVLAAWPERAGRLYAFDLAGAAIGVLLLFVALPVLGARGAVALAAALGLAAALLLAASRARRLAMLPVLAASLLLVARPQTLPDVRLDPTKPVVAAASAPGARLAYTRWSPLARIDVVESQSDPPMIFLDAGAATPVPASRDSLVAQTDGSALAPAIRRNGAIAIIGSGGGIDVQNALALGARSVTAIEINPVILQLVRGRYANASSRVFFDPRVTVVRDEGRSAIARSRRKFDVIQSTLIDTWAASASGAYSLTENYLYTVEAMQTFLDHLAPDGLLTITRWYYESPRLVSVIRAALARRGVTDFPRHLMVIEQRMRTTVVVKNEPFTPGESAALSRFAALSAERIVQHDPNAPSDTSFFSVFLASPNPQQFYRATDFAVTPVTDDSPFFFQLTRWSRLRLAQLSTFTGRNMLEPVALPIAQIVLVVALVVAVVLSLGLLAVPLAARAAPGAGRWRWLAYFGALGVAYIAVEVALMQRLALLLGHPTYSVTLTLFAILLFTGLGASWADRLKSPASVVARPLLAALAVALLFIAFVLPRLVPLWLPLPLPMRVALATIVIAPAAFTMGLPFPLAIRALGGERGAVAWAWAANGCGSVVGSVLAVLGAMLTGFTVVLTLAAVVYTAALLILAAAPEARAQIPESSA